MHPVFLWLIYQQKWLSMNQDIDPASSKINLDNAHYKFVQTYFS